MPSIASIAPRTWSWWASLRQFTTTSSSRSAVFTSKPSRPDDVAADLADGGGQLAEHAGLVVHADADADGVRGGRCVCHTAR